MFKVRYGLPFSVFQGLFEKQKGLCAICRCNPAKHTDHDHDHASNRIRGLLCPSCNLALGLMKESLQTLRNAIPYLKRV